MKGSIDLRPVREIYKHQDLDEVDKDILDPLYNRKWEIYNSHYMRVTVDGKTVVFTWLPDYTKDGEMIQDYTYDRKLKYSNDFEKAWDSKSRKWVWSNSAYYLAGREFLKRQRIYPESGWLGNDRKSCCEFKFVRVKNFLGKKTRYILYKTRLLNGKWSPRKYIEVKSLNPSRKKKYIRRLVKSGANKQKVANFFKLSLRRVQHITKGIKQKKFKPENGLEC